MMEPGDGLPLLIKFVRRAFRSTITVFFRFPPDVQSQRVPGFNYLGDSTRGGDPTSWVKPRLLILDLFSSSPVFSSSSVSFLSLGCRGDNIETFRLYTRSPSLPAK